MNHNEQTLIRFYSAFAALDADTMANCYAEGAIFEDPAFSLKGRHDVGGMWRMLCDATKSKGREDLRSLQPNIRCALGGKPQKTTNLPFDVQIETRLKHQIQQANH